MRQQLREQMYKLVREYENSTQSQQAFCSEHGIKVHKLQYWRTKYRSSQDSSTQFAEIAISPPRKQQAGVIIISLPNGTTIEIPT